jgi:hypothetical protein
MQISDFARCLAVFLRPFRPNLATTSSKTVNATNKGYIGQQKKNGLLSKQRRSFFLLIFQI